MAEIDEDELEDPFGANGWAFRFQDLLWLTKVWSEPSSLNAGDFCAGGTCGAVERETENTREVLANVNKILKANNASGYAAVITAAETVLGKSTVQTLCDDVVNYEAGSGKSWVDVKKNFNKQFEMDISKPLSDASWGELAKELKTEIANVILAAPKAL